MVSPTLLVMAAGMGSRYGGLKQIDPVGPDGETIMDYSIFDALRAGFGKVVFVIRKDIEQQFKQMVGARFEKRVAVDYVFQELGKLTLGFTVPAGRTKPWGTTHAILMAANTIREPFAVINSDDFYGAETYRALAHHLQSGTTDYAMAGFTLRHTLSEFGTVSRGVCRASSDHYLEEIVELEAIERDGGHARNTDAAGEVTKLTGNEIVSMNMWGFTPQVFPQLREHFLKFLQVHGADVKAESYIPSVVNELIASSEARVKVLLGGGTWFGVTYREDRTQAVESIRRMIQEGHYPRRVLR
jgi:NDP-sugar pyrophosphorylase family protein